MFDGGGTTTSVIRLLPVARAQSPPVRPAPATSPAQPPRPHSSPGRPANGSPVRLLARAENLCKNKPAQLIARETVGKCTEDDDRDLCVSTPRSEPGALH